MYSILITQKKHQKEEETFMSKILSLQRKTYASSVFFSHAMEGKITGRTTGQDIHGVEGQNCCLKIYSTAKHKKNFCNCEKLYDMYLITDVASSLTILLARLGGFTLLLLVFLAIFLS